MSGEGGGGRKEEDVNVTAGEGKDRCREATNERGLKTEVLNKGKGRGGAALNMHFSDVYGKVA